MKLNPLFITAAIVPLLFSCKSETDNDVIRLDGTFNDNFLESWEYIILEEDNPDAMLGAVNPNIRHDDGLFFICSEADRSSSIKVFDRNGRYMNNICRTGRAGNECLSLNNWTLDTYNNQVVVTISNGYCGSVSIKRFDYQGNYLGQTETDTLGATCILGHVIKCTADGTLLIEDNRIHSVPTHEYFNIHNDGSISALTELSEYRTNGVLVDPTSFFQTGVWKKDLESGNSTIYLAVSNPHCDTSYVTRKFDNGIYRICGDRSELVAELPFIPEASDAIGKVIRLEDNTDIDPYQISYYMDMKDYLYMEYLGEEYIFEKATSNVYEMTIDTINALCPSHFYGSVYGNDVISSVDLYSIREALERMDSKDYDHRYSPEVEAFYRKTRNCQNPPIIIAHYK